MILVEHEQGGLAMNASDINKVFDVIKEIVGDGEMHILDLVDALEERGISTSDISFVNAHLVTWGRLEMGEGYAIRVADPTPYSFAVVS